MDETNQNKAILTASKLSILTIDTVNIMLVLDLPANEIQFQLTYNPGIFQFIPSSVQCSLQEINVDSTSTPGIIKFSGKSQDPSITATAVTFTFRPLQASSLAGFIASGLVTNTGAVLTIPTVNVTVNATPIYSAIVFPSKPDTPPMVGGIPPYMPPAPPLTGSPVPPPPNGCPMPPPANNGTTNKAILTASKLSIYTIETVNIMLVLDLPANEIQFQLTYNPNIFQFIPSSVQCSLQGINVDSTSTLGIIKFYGKSQDPSITATAVTFTFRPLQASPLAGFIASGLVTNTGAVLTIPTVNVTINLTPIVPIRPFPVAPFNPDNPPMVGSGVNSYPPTMYNPSQPYIIFPPIYIIPPFGMM